MENSNVDNGNSQEKLFTQEEVNEIVKKRVERCKAAHDPEAQAVVAEKAAQLDLREKELDERVFAFDCKEYLRDNGYDMEYMDIISAEDIDTFKTKADKLASLVKAKSQPKYPPFVANENIGGGLEEAFSPDYKHTPKSFGYGK